jgi:hypothetical protein
MACFLHRAIAQTASEKTFDQRGKVRSFSATEVVLEAVDLPAPQAFVITPETQTGPLRAGELVRVRFVLVGDRRIARAIVEIVATAVNLPRGSAAPGSSSSASVNMPRGSTTQGTATSASVNMPMGTASARTLSSAPISLAADDSQLALIRGPGIHQSGVHDPIRIAILDLQPTSGADLTPELAAGISDRLAGLLQNDSLFTLLDRGKLHDLPTTDLPTTDLPTTDLPTTGLDDPATIVKLANLLDKPDAILLGEIREEQPSPSEDPGPRRRKIQVTFPTITLEARLYDARTGHLLGTPKGMGGGQQDRPDDHSSPLLRAVRDAVESLAAAIDPEYPSLLDPRTFVTMTASEQGRLTVTFPAAPTVQLGNRLQVSHPTWFTRDPAAGNLIAVSPEPLGTLTITNLEKSEASGPYQGTPPAPGQTIRLSR